MSALHVSPPDDNHLTLWFNFWRFTFEVRSRLVFVSIILLLCLSVSGQNSAAPAAVKYQYLLHLETMNFDDQVCVLLHGDGRFHLEEERGDRTRVSEGTLSVGKMDEVQHLINDDALRQLTQKQVVLPVGNIVLDELHIDIFRGDHWQDLFFPDASSRRPFDHSIAPLVRWLEALHREPHTEISEDAGKNDCQLPKRIVLKLRKRKADGDPVRP